VDIVSVTIDLKVVGGMPALYINILIKNRELATVWTIKYFSILFIEILLLLNNKGVKTIIFISRATHIWNQFDLEKAIILV